MNGRWGLVFSMIPLWRSVVGHGMSEGSVFFALFSNVFFSALLSIVITRCLLLPSQEAGSF
jgi:hypothetical protein